jgi:GTPase Era involved in 16S rRNA processing
VIDASIVANRDSQKIILLGKNGSMIKNIGMKAREKLEQVRVFFLLILVSLLSLFFA